jgi:aminoglycoside 3-N-acetyltransferase
MLPTFNYTSPLPRPYYDPNGTPCRTGAIPETGRKRRGAVRSLHPTHSVAVIGPDAASLTADHLQHRAFGKASPIGRLVERNGTVLLIGVDHRANSMVHVAEEYADIPKVEWREEPAVAKVRMPDGKMVPHELDTSPSCSAAFGAVEARLRLHDEVRDARAGKALLQLVLARDVIKRACEMMAEKADVLLCTWEDCDPCCSTRKELRRLGRL